MTVRGYVRTCCGCPLVFHAKRPVPADAASPPSALLSLAPDTALIERYCCCGGGMSMNDGRGSAAA